MRPRPSRVTIKQVASEARVSTQTVSPRDQWSARCLSRNAGARSGRDRTHAVSAQRPGAQSNPATHLHAGDRNSGPQAYWSISDLNGIAQAAEQAGYGLLLKELPSYDAEDIVPIFDALVSRHVDGIIWAVPEVGENRKPFSLLPLPLTVPIVYITMEARDGLASVSIDNYLGGQLATAHLVEQGYRRIGHISGPLDWWGVEAASGCLEGYPKSTRPGGGRPPVGGRRLVVGQWRPGSSKTLLPISGYGRGLRGQRPDGTQCTAGHLPTRPAACQKTWELLDLTILPNSAFFSPPLTTVQQDQYNLARIAVEEIISIIGSSWQGLDPAAPRSIKLPPALVVRESSMRSRNQRKGGEAGKA